MKVIDDGIIKYDRTNFSQCGPLPEEEFIGLEYWRKKLYKLNLIGEYPEIQVGFGNISQIFDYSKILKVDRPQFVITSTQTGKFADLDGRHYTRILDFSIDQLKVQMQGPIEASSEVLTHAAAYEHNSKIKALFHIHSTEIWNKMIKNNAPFTAENIPYGTVEMARATQACIGDRTSGTICMRGHQDGVIAFGTTLEETWEIIFQLYENRN